MSDVISVVKAAEPALPLIPKVINGIRALFEDPVQEYRQDKRDLREDAENVLNLYEKQLGALQWEFDKLGLANKTLQEIYVEESKKGLGIFNKKRKLNELAEQLRATHRMLLFIVNDVESALDCLDKDDALRQGNVLSLETYQRLTTLMAHRDLTVNQIIDGLNEIYKEARYK